MSLANDIIKLSESFKKSKGFPVLPDKKIEKKLDVLAEKLIKKFLEQYLISTNEVEQWIEEEGLGGSLDKIQAEFEKKFPKFFKSDPREYFTWAIGDLISSKMK